MKKDYTVGKTGKREEIPGRVTTKRDYESMIKSVATLEVDDYVEFISEDGKDFADTLKHKLKKAFKNMTFTVTRRTHRDSDKLSIFVIRDS